MESDHDDVAARVAELARLKIMDSEQDPVLDDLVRTAALSVDAPICLISLVDDKRQWFKAAFGIPRGGSPIEASFCARVIRHKEFMIVKDAQADPVFSANPFVTGDPHIRFYAGVPLISSNNVRLGALCVIDQIPHPGMRAADLLLLQKLARLAVLEIERTYPPADAPPEADQ